MSVPLCGIRCFYFVELDAIELVVVHVTAMGTVSLWCVLMWEMSPSLHCFFSLGVMIVIERRAVLVALHLC